MKKLSQAVLLPLSNFTLPLPACAQKNQDKAYGESRSAVLV